MLRLGGYCPAVKQIPSDIGAPLAGFKAALAQDHSSANADAFAGHGDVQILPWSKVTCEVRYEAYVVCGSMPDTFRTSEGPAR